MCNFDAIFCQIKFYIVYAWSWYDRSVYFAFLYEADNSPARIIGICCTFCVSTLVSGDSFPCIQLFKSHKAHRPFYGYWCLVELSLLIYIPCQLSREYKSLERTIQQSCQYHKMLSIYCKAALLNSSFTNKTLWNANLSKSYYQNLNIKSASNVYFVIKCNSFLTPIIMCYMFHTFIVLKYTSHML